MIKTKDKLLFLLMRHGRTEGNDENTYRSWSNANKAQLSDEGRRGVLKAAAYLKEHEVPVELIVCDSLDRAFETAEIVASELGVEKIIPVRRLHPVNMGDWTLKSKAEHPPSLLWKDPDKAPPNGQSLNQFNEVQFAVFKLIFEVVDGMPDDAKMLVIGHGSNVAFLHNRIFNKDDAPVEYEGLVDPAGLIAVTAGGLVPLTNVRRPKKGDEE